MILLSRKRWTRAVVNDLDEVVIVRGLSFALFYSDDIDLASIDDDEHGVDEESY